MGKKDEILQAAELLFAEQGYAFSMSQLAEKVGMRTPSLYSHFRSKDEIVEKATSLAIFDCRRELEAFADSLEGRGAEEKLELIFRYLLDYFSAGNRLRFWKNMLLLPQPELRGKCRAELSSQNHWFTLLLRGLFADGAIRGELRCPEEGDAYLYFVLIQGLLDVRLLLGDREEEFSAYAERVWGAFREGVLARREKP